MTEIINLNQKRKAMARAEKEKKASQNRIKFGRTKAEKNKQKRDAGRAGDLLDGHRLENEEKE